MSEKNTREGGCESIRANIAKRNAMKRAQYSIVNAHIYLYISIYGNLHICRYIEKPIFPFPDENEKFGFGKTPGENFWPPPWNFIKTKIHILASPTLRG